MATKTGLIKIIRKKEETREIFVPTTKYGFSIHQDLALDLCLREYGTCPFGYVKDGAPNCHARVTGFVASWTYNAQEQCEPGRLTQEAASVAFQRQQAEWQAKLDKRKPA